MQNFIYHTPTKLIFGKGSIKNLPEVLAPLGKNVLLTYGGGSIKKIGLYDEVKELLRIEPNPKYSTSVLSGVKMCKENNIDVVLAVGGGSVLDCSKAICAGALYDGEPWDLITYKVKAKKALPLVDVLTLAATGSEYDMGCVISRTETNDKVGYLDELLFPVASILDPCYTFSVSKKQTAAGAADAINHVIEQYFCADHSTLSDGMCEAAIKSLIENAHIVLSAYYDITHGEGLAIITPRWMKHILNETTLERFVSFGTHIFGIDKNLEPMAIAEKTIEETYNLFVSFGMPMHLKEVGIGEEKLSEMAHHIAVNEGLEKAYAPLNEGDILEILKASL